MLKRILMTILVMLLAMIFLSAMPYLVPGDPVKTILGPRASQELVERVRHDMGLDLPVPVQIASFVRRALKGDLGSDFVSGLPVLTLIREVLPHTIILAISSLALAALLGIPLGIFSATHPDSLLDRLTWILSVSFITLPPYVAGLLLLLLFSVSLGWFPAIGAGDLSRPLDVLQHLVLPAFALALAWIGYLARLVRASLLEVMTADYIRTAAAYGLRPHTIYFKYALRNAIIPTVAVLGVGLGSLLGGAVFIEVIFSRPGLGQLIYNSISDRNYPIVRGGILVAALMFVFANLLADLSYRFLDPRLQAEELMR